MTRNSFKSVGFDEQHAVADAMILEGGSFVSELGHALKKADTHNASIIKRCFCDYWLTYARIARLVSTIKHETQVKKIHEHDVECRGCRSKILNFKKYCLTDDTMQWDCQNCNSKMTARADLIDRVEIISLTRGVLNAE